MGIPFSNLEDRMSSLYQLSSNLTISSRFGKHLLTALFCDFLFAPADAKSVSRNDTVNTNSIRITGEDKFFGQVQLIITLAGEKSLMKKGFCAVSRDSLD